MKKIVAAFFAAALFAGCVSVEENRLVNGTLSVEVNTDGWYVFGFVPIASGDPDCWWPNWFTNDVDPEKTMKVLGRIAEREKTEKFGPIVTREEDENILIVITRVSYHTSAILYPNK